MLGMKPALGVKPIYRSSSHVPTRGTNRPEGYIKREIKLNAAKQGPFGGVSKFGSTGRSETRSGLTREALMNMAKRQVNKITGPTATGGKLQGVKKGSYRFPRTPVPSTRTGRTGSTRVNPSRKGRVPSNRVPNGDPFANIAGKGAFKRANPALQQAALAHLRKILNAQKAARGS